MANKGVKIILVEDDENLAEMYTMKFKEEKIVFLYAADGLAGLELVQQETPQVVLLDIMMPKMDGFAVLSEMRKNEKTRNIPVIMLSNLGQEADIEKGQALGATDYIVKATMTPSQVIAKVKQYLK